MARSRRRALGVVAAGSLLVACNSIIGLSDFNKGECNGGGACLEPDASTADVVTPEAGSLDGGSEGGQGTDPVSWARWQMPNYPGADANVLTDLHPNSDGTVTDNKTQLVWQAKALTGSFAFADAQAACAAIKTSAGPWRLPKRIELVTLLDYSHDAPFVDTSAFTVPALTAWTSSEYRTVDDNNKVTVTTKLWTVSFEDGSLKQTDGAVVGPIALCVKGATQ